MAQVRLIPLHEYMAGWLSELASRRRGWPVVAACAAGLLLSGSPAQAGPRQPAQAPAAPDGLPGPRPGCPPQHGIAAPAAAPWAQQELGFASVWNRTRGAGVTVAVVDSGVDANPQFGDRVIPGPDLVAGTKPGIPPGADCVGHGTAVASIIAAAPVPGVSFTGVAPAARILSVKISGTDTFPTSATPQGIMDAVQFGADVINLSLATPDDVPALRNAVEYALRQNVVVVAAAGNDIQQGGAGGNGPFYPAAYPGVLAVGAAGPGGALAGFSDRHTPVAVTAPGVNVTSAYPGTFPDAYDPAQSGTSFAAAFVSGVVALVRVRSPRAEPRPRWWRGSRPPRTAGRPGHRPRPGRPGPGGDRGAARRAEARRQRQRQRHQRQPGRRQRRRSPAAHRSAPVAVIAGSFGLWSSWLTAVLVSPPPCRRTGPVRTARGARATVRRHAA